MNAQWTHNARQWPIVEFHDLNCEAGGRDGLMDANGESGATSYFGVYGEPDRLVMIRGFAGMEERRIELGNLIAAPSWAERRRRSADLLREGSARLVRTLSPEKSLRLGWGAPVTSCVALVSELRFAEQIGNYHLWLRLLLRKSGLDPFASYATLEMENDVPAVPVRRYRSEHIAFVAAEGEVPDLPRELRGMLRVQPEILRLEPIWQQAVRAG